MQRFSLLLIIFLALAFSACSNGSTTLTADITPSDSTVDDSGSEVICTPDCTDMNCGSDGCGGSCGECEDGMECSVLGTCACLANCTGKVCGDDGCDGSCGECEDGSSCVQGQCDLVCEPDCEGKECGDDGCDGSCGECEPGLECLPDEGVCVAVDPPECEDKECGDDGMGGSCGECEEGFSCVNFLCVEGCDEFDCEGKNCGDDGCGGLCGECSDLEFCQEGQCTCKFVICDDTCCLKGEECIDGVCTIPCIPDCDGKQCGDDGCQGSCGECLYEGPKEAACIEFACEEFQCVLTELDSACEDGDECTLDDTCKSGFCTGGSIDTENAMCVCCTENGCEDDGNLCNGLPICNDETCVCETDLTSVINCEVHETPCYKNICQPDTGECLEALADADTKCNDSDGCTVNDICDEAGNCAGSPKKCDDMDVCTGQEVCLDGECVSPDPLTCEDDNPCTDDHCDMFVGCLQTPNQVECDDLDACTEGDLCADGACVAGIAAVCNDDIDCTVDSCSPEMGCIFMPDSSLCVDDNLCTDEACNPDTGCTFSPNNATCDDSDLCTENDICENGACQSGAALVCSDDNPCTIDGCDPATGCLAPVPDNTALCDDNDPCTEVDECVDGACVGINPTVCDDQVDCTVDTCLPGNGCDYVPDNAGCDDNNLCTTGVCNQDTGCIFTDVVCTDEDACTDDTCSPETGCIFTPNNDSCSDDNPCTTDVCGCTGQQDQHLPIDCGDDNACTDDSCNQNDGECVNTPIVCDDQKLCTNDSCNTKSGCVFAAISCEDNDACTDDSCNPDTGDCINATITCDDSTLCTEDSCNPNSGCVFDTIVCTDNVDCTDDTCEAATGCKFTANHSKCNDAKACTTDICNPSAGCEHGNAQDGTLCPGGDNYECLTGTCVCMPECGNNECGSNGCGGSCGSCDPDENCVNGECVEPYACADILQCALGCNFSMECTNSCYGNASDSSKQVFTALALCIATQCGFVVDQGCYLQAAQGPCVIQASTCLTD